MGEDYKHHLRLYILHPRCHRHHRILRRTPRHTRHWVALDRKVRRNEVVRDHGFEDRERHRRSRASTILVMDACCFRSNCIVLHFHELLVS